MSTPELTRRRFVAGTAGAALFGAGVVGGSVWAQNATPQPQQQSAAATPETASAASPAANAIGSARFPVRTPLGPAVPPEYTDAETNWPSENRDLSSTRQAKGSTISSQTIRQLGLGWSFAVPISSTYGALVAAPAIAGDVLYQQDAMSNVYALNKTTGKEIWRNEYNKAVPSGGPNGVALGYGMIVYTLGGPGDVIGAKADTGKEVWRTNIEGLRHEGITMAPLIYDSTVYVSTIPGTPEKFYQGNQRGIIVAINLSDGNVLWYFDTTVDNLWGSDGGNARVNSGGGLWHPPSVDENGKLYVGTGNASPYPGIPQFPSAASRPGPNDYTNSLIKIDPDRAAIDWFINIKPHDLFDLDNQLSPVLTEVGGKPVIFTSGKHGYVACVDRETGQELWRTAVGEHQNDDLQELPTDGSTVKVLPGTLGGVETPLAYAEGLVFAPVFNMASVYTAEALDPTSIDLAAATGQLVALDAATGKIVWDVKVPTGILGGATVINDVVFTGGLDGVVRGFTTADGQQVFSYQVTAGMNAPFAVSGDHLYVPAGGPLLASKDTANPAPKPAAQLVALKIGGEIQTAPSGTPSAASPEAGGAAPTASGNTVEVHAVDINFDPKELSIKANTDVTISLTNQGVLQHDLVIENTNFMTPLLNGGEHADLKVNLPAGKYIYYCSVPGHREAGMQGTLTVG